MNNSNPSHISQIVGQDLPHSSRPHLYYGLCKIELFLLFVKDVLSTIKDFTQHRIPQTIFLGIFLKDVLSKINEKARLRQSNAMAHVTDNKNK